jgi:hypothetical protein
MRLRSATQAIGRLLHALQRLITVPATRADAPQHTAQPPSLVTFELML